MGFEEGLERMQLARESAMVSYESACRKKHIMAEHQREAAPYNMISRLKVAAFGAD